jgi:hypothetical protein
MNVTGRHRRSARPDRSGPRRLTEAAAAACRSGSGGLCGCRSCWANGCPTCPKRPAPCSACGPALLRPGHLYRAALEGTSLNLAAGLDRLRAPRPAGRRSAPRRRRLGQPLWQQILANLFGVAVRPLLEAESAALGAAMQAAWAVRRGRGEPDLPIDASRRRSCGSAAAVAPEARWAPAHQALRVRFREQLERLHPGAPADVRGPRAAPGPAIGARRPRPYGCGMFLTRKIGSVLRGKATPLQVLFATVLGGMLGFVPGFFLPGDLGRRPPMQAPWPDPVAAVPRAGAERQPRRVRPVPRWWRSC